MISLIKKLAAALAILAGWLMIAMMALLVIDVIWREFGMPLQGLATLSVFVMLLVIYLGFGHCEDHGEHVRMEFLLGALPGKAHDALVVFCRILAVITVGLLTYAIFRDASFAWKTGDAIEGLIDFPLWPTKFVMLVGVVVFLAVTILNIPRPLDPDHEEEHAKDFI